MNVKQQRNREILDFDNETVKITSFWKVTSCSLIDRAYVGECEST